MGWVKSDDIATVDDDFVRQWTHLLQTQPGAVTRDHTNFIDQKGSSYFIARTGTLLPLRRTGDHRQAVIPVRRDNGQAVMHSVSISEKDMATMPLH